MMLIANAASPVLIFRLSRILSLTCSLTSTRSTSWTLVCFPFESYRPFVNFPVALSFIAILNCNYSLSVNNFYIADNKSQTIDRIILLHSISVTLTCHSIFTHNGLSWVWSRVSVLFDLRLLHVGFVVKKWHWDRLFLKYLVLACQYIPPISILLFHLCITDARI